VPRKTFHFEPDFDQAHLVLFEAYLRLSGLCAALMGIVEAEGQDIEWARRLLKEADLLVAHTIRNSDQDLSAN
jgi:hypothetical protein